MTEGVWMRLSAVRAHSSRSPAIATPQVRRNESLQHDAFAQSLPVKEWNYALVIVSKTNKSAPLTIESGLRPKADSIGNPATGTPE